MSWPGSAVKWNNFSTGVTMDFLNRSFEPGEGQSERARLRPQRNRPVMFFLLIRSVRQTWRLPRPSSLTFSNENWVGLDQRS
jgi:hypothetical protein